MRVILVNTLIKDETRLMTTLKLEVKLAHMIKYFYI